MSQSLLHQVNDSIGTMEDKEIIRLFESQSLLHQVNDSIKEVQAMSNDKIKVAIPSSSGQ